MRKSFTRLFGLFMLLSMFSFNVVAQTFSPESGATNARPSSLEAGVDKTITLSIALDDAISMPTADGTGIVALNHWDGTTWKQVQTVQIDGQESDNADGSTVTIADDAMSVEIMFVDNSSTTIDYDFDSEEKFIVTVSADAFSGAGDFVVNSDYAAFTSVGNYSPANVETKGWFFQIGVAEDFAGPEAIAYYPADDTTGVGLVEVGFTAAEGKLANNTNDYFTIKFSETVELSDEFTAAGSGKSAYITLYKASGDIVEIVDLTADALTAYGTQPVVGDVNHIAAGSSKVIGDELYINWGLDLEPLTEYFIRITEGAIVDAEGEPFTGVAGNSDWNFTTGQFNDLTAALVTPTIDHQEDAAVVVEFASGSADGEALVLLGSDNGVELTATDDLSTYITLNVAVPYTATYIGENKVSISLDDDATFPHFTEYTVSIVADKFYDQYGNSMAATDLTFSTEDLNAPVETSATVDPYYGTSAASPQALLKASTAVDYVAGDRNAESSSFNIYYYVVAAGTDVSEVTQAMMKENASSTVANKTVATALETILASYYNGTELVAFESDTEYDVYVVLEDNARKNNTSVLTAITVTTPDVEGANFSVTYGADYASSVAYVAGTPVKHGDKIYVTFDDVVTPTGTVAEAIKFRRDNTVVDFGTITSISGAAGTTVYECVTGDVNLGNDVNSFVDYYFDQEELDVVVIANKFEDDAAGAITGQLANKVAGGEASFKVEDYTGPLVTFDPVDGDGSTTTTEVALSDLANGLTVTFTEKPYALNEAGTLVALDDETAGLTNIASHVFLRYEATGAQIPNLGVEFTSETEVKVTLPAGFEWDSEVEYTLYVGSLVKDVNSIGIATYNDGSQAYAPNTSVPAAGDAEKTEATFTVEDFVIPAITFSQDADATLDASYTEDLEDLLENDNIALQFNEDLYRPDGGLFDPTDFNQVRSYIELKDAAGDVVEFEIVAAKNATATDDAVVLIKLLDNPYDANDGVFVKQSTYTVLVDGLKDDAENSINISGVYTTEYPAFDFESLTVADWATLTYIPLEGDLVLTFNNQVYIDNSTAVITLTDASAAAPTMNFALNQIGVVVSGSTISVPYAGLAPNTTYNVSFSADLVQDAEGNAFDMSGESATVTTLDAYGPIIDITNSDVSPLDGTLAAIDGDLTITFSTEAGDLAGIEKGTGFIVVHKIEPVGATNIAQIDVESDEVTIAGQVVTVKLPIALEYSTQYAVEMDATCFTDQSAQLNEYQFVSPVTAQQDGPITLNTDAGGNVLYADQDWKFTTIANPGPAGADPAYDVAGFVPAIDAVSVSATDGLKITFTQPTKVKEGVTENQRFIIHEFDASATPPFVPTTESAVETFHIDEMDLSTAWNDDNTMLTLSHRDFAADKYYIIEIDAEVFVDIDSPAEMPAFASTITALPEVEDVQGSFDGTGWYFTTVNWDAPAVASIAISENDCGDALTAGTLTVTFTENVTVNAAADINTIFTGITLTNGTLVDNVITYDYTGLAVETDFALTLTDDAVAATDNGVYNVEAVDVFTFTTEDTQAPGLSALAFVERTGSSIKVSYTTTNDADQTVYFVKYTADEAPTTAPDADAIIDAEEHTQVLTALGAQEYTFSGLEEKTEYVIYAVSVDASCSKNKSSVVTTTESTLDVTAPVILSSIPADESTCVQFDASNEVEVSFKMSELVQAGEDGKLVVRKVSTNEAVASYVFADLTEDATDSTYSVMVPSLDAGVEYYVELDYGFFADEYNSALTPAEDDLLIDTLIAHWYGATEYAWNFKIDETEFPAYAGDFNPAHESTNVATWATDAADRNLSITFDAPVQIQSGVVNIYREDDAATPQEIINVSTGTLSADGKTVTFPRRLRYAAQTIYYVTVSEKAFKDESCIGNYSAAIDAPTSVSVDANGLLTAASAGSWVFQTADEEAPEGSLCLPDFAAGTTAAGDVLVEGVNTIGRQLFSDVATQATQVIAVLPFEEAVYTKDANGALVALTSTTDVTDYFSVDTAVVNRYTHVAGAYAELTNATVSYDATSFDFVVKFEDGYAATSLTSYKVAFIPGGELFDAYGNVIEGDAGAYSTDDWESPVAMYYPAIADKDAKSGIVTDVAYDVNPTITWNKFLVYNNFPHENHPPMDANEDGEVDADVVVTDYITFTSHADSANAVDGTAGTPVEFSVEIVEGTRYVFNNTASGIGQQYTIVPTNNLESDMFYRLEWTADDQHPAEAFELRTRDQVRYDSLHQGNQVVDGNLGSGYTVFRTFNSEVPTIEMAGMNAANNAFPFGSNNVASPQITDLSNTTLNIEFNIPVFAKEGNIIIRESDGSYHETIDVTTLASATAATDFTIEPTIPFVSYKDYYVEFEGGTFATPSGVEYAGTIDIDTDNVDENRYFYFTTQDGSNPYIIRSYPDDNSSEISVSTAISFIFSEQIENAYYGNLVIYKGLPAAMNGGVDGVAIEIIDLDTDDRVALYDSDFNNGKMNDSLVIELGNYGTVNYFDSNENYYVRIDNGAIKDLNGNEYAGQTAYAMGENGNMDYWTPTADDATDYAYNFSTSDNTNPTWVTLTPEVDPTVLLAQDPLTLVMTTNIDVIAGEGNFKLYEYYNNDGTNAQSVLVEEIDVTSDAVVFDGTTVTVSTETRLRDNMTYYVLIDPAAITNTLTNKDRFVSHTAYDPNSTRPGNSAGEYGIQNPFEWRFNTGADKVAPVLSEENAISIEGDTCVSNTSIIEFTFDEGVAVANVDGFTANDGSTTIVATEAVATDNTVAVSFEDLADNTAYTFTVSAKAVTDTSTVSTGYVLDADYLVEAADSNFFAGTTFDFATTNFIAPVVEEMTAPVVDADDSIKVNFDDMVTVTFSDEAIDLGTGAVALYSVDTAGVKTMVAVADSLNLTGDVLVAMFPAGSFADYTTYAVVVEEGVVMDRVIAGYCGTELPNTEATITVKTGDVTLPTVDVNDEDYKVNTFAGIFEFSEAVTGTITVGDTDYAIASMKDSIEITGEDGELVNYTVVATDAAGNEAEIAGAFMIGDNTAPVYTATSPEADETLALPTEYDEAFKFNFTLTFDEGVEAVAGQNIVIESDQLETPMTIAATDLEATDSTNMTYYVTVTELTQVGAYTVTVPEGAFVDAAVDAIAGSDAVADSTWTFFIADEDFSCLDGIFGYSTDGDEYIDVNEDGVYDIYVDFCEDIKASTDPDAALYIYDFNNNELVAEISILDVTVEGDSLIFSSDALSPSTKYNFTFTDGFITDTYDNKFSSVDIVNLFTFTTDDNQAPEITVTGTETVEVYNRGGEVEIAVNEVAALYLSDSKAFAAGIELAAEVTTTDAVAYSVEGVTAGTYYACAEDLQGNQAVDTTVAIVVVNVPEVAIADVRDSYVGEMVSVTGYVTYATAEGFYMQDGETAGSGIYVVGSATAGETVEVYGMVSNAGLTTITAEEVTEAAAMAAPAAVEAGSADLAAYESMLVTTATMRATVASDEVTLAETADVNIAIETAAGVTLIDGNWYNVTGISIADAIIATSADINTSNVDVEMVDVYPNPFDGFIKLSNVNGIERVVITNLAGQLVMDVMNPTQEISTYELRSGVYLISLHTSEGIAKTERIIKK